MLDQETQSRIDETREHHQFLSVLVMNDEIKIGIVQNETTKIIYFFDIERIRDSKLRTEFIKYGHEWWWNSNRSVPIDSFIGENFDAFRNECLIGYPKNSIDHIIGPTFSLSALYNKRIKKRKVEIISKERPIK